MSNEANLKKITVIGSCNKSDETIRTSKMKRQENVIK